MPEIREVLDLTSLDRPALEARRRAILDALNTQYRGYDDPSVPEDLLCELSIVLAALKRRTVGPPKRKTSLESKAAKSVKSKKTTTSDIINF